MILQSYYKQGPLTGAIEVKQLVNNLPALCTLYVAHDINGIIVKKEFPTVDKAFSFATTVGCNRDKWEHKDQKLSIDDGSK